MVVSLRPIRSRGTVGGGVSMLFVLPGLAYRLPPEPLPEDRERVDRGAGAVHEGLAGTGASRRQALQRDRAAGPAPPRGRLVGLLAGGGARAVRARRARDRERGVRAVAPRRRPRQERIEERTPSHRQRVGPGADRPRGRLHPRGRPVGRVGVHDEPARLPAEVPRARRRGAPGATRARADGLPHERADAGLRGGAQGRVEEGPDRADGRSRPSPHSSTSTSGGITLSIERAPRAARPTRRTRPAAATSPRRCVGPSTSASGTSARSPSAARTCSSSSPIASPTARAGRARWTTSTCSAVGTTCSTSRA